MNAMTNIQALILGLVEGITEYLPISSTGHLIIASALMGLDETETQKSAVDTFNIVIQGGAILAVLGLYFARVVQMCRGAGPGQGSVRRAEASRSTSSSRSSRRRCSACCSTT